MNYHDIYVVNQYFIKIDPNHLPMSTELQKSKEFVSTEVSNVMIYKKYNLLNEY